MTRELFAKSIESMREFWTWTDNLEKNGISFDDKKMELLNEAMMDLLSDGKNDWSYDPIAGIDWILEYTANRNFFSDYGSYFRNGRVWNLKSAEALYDFIEDMNRTVNKNERERSQS